MTNILLLLLTAMPFVGQPQMPHQQVPIRVQTIAAAEGNSLQPDSAVTINADGSYRNKYTYTYDASGHKSLEMLYEWADGAWVNREKMDHTYDANGNETRDVTYTWNGRAWEGYAKNERTYDANGNRTSYTEYVWQDGAWVGESLYENTYDDEGNLSTTAVYYRADSDWVLIFTTYLYYPAPSTGLSAPEASSAAKRFENGRVVIRRGGQAFDATGRMVR